MLIGNGKPCSASAPWNGVVIRDAGLLSKINHHIRTLSVSVSYITYHIDIKFFNDFHPNYILTRCLGYMYSRLHYVIMVSIIGYRSLYLPIWDKSHSYKIGGSTNGMSLVPHERLLILLQYLGCHPTQVLMSWANKVSESAINTSIALTRDVLHEKMIPRYLKLPTLPQAKEEAKLFARRFPPKRSRSRRPDRRRRLNRRQLSKYDFPKIIEFAVDGTYVNSNTLYFYYNSWTQNSLYWHWILFSSSRILMGL